MRALKHIFAFAVLSLAAAVGVMAQSSIKVEAPNVVGADEQFNVTFIIEGEKGASDFSWSQGDDFQLVWGPQKGTSTRVSVINGKRTSSHQTTYTYILLPKATGSFQIQPATATVSGEKISSSPVSIQVVTDASSQRGGQGGQGQDRDSAGDGSGGSTQKAAKGEIPSEDLFLKLSLSRSEVVLGEPLTATLKLYQRVNIAGFENAKFPTFNGFWSQETYSPTNIEFKRESFDDKIYNTAVLRSYVLIPQQSGVITVDPAELVCLVNVRVNSSTSNSIFDSFFQDEYRTIRKRVTTPSVRVKVNPLPAGQPASFGGGVGSFGISARLSSGELKTHDAGSLVVTVSGRGNVSLLEQPKVSFPPDFEVYDTKSTENTDKSNGGTSGSKSFEFPFIPRSAGDFTIPPVEYSYYDINTGKYVTLRTEPLKVKVSKGKGSETSGPVTVTSPGVERRDVKSLGDDIRFITTKKPSFSREGAFLVGSALFWILLGIILAAALVTWLATREVAAMRADVAKTKNRRATKMAKARLRQAGDFLDKNLYTAFYEELHKALIGFISDKLNMDMTDISRDNIESALLAGGVSSEDTGSFTALLDACEFARYSPDAGHEAMNAHYESAVKAITAIDSSLKAVKSRSKGVSAAILILLSLGIPANLGAQNDQLVVVPSDTTAVSAGNDVEAAGPSDAAGLWERGVAAYSDTRYKDAITAWEAILSSGEASPELYCNIGDAWFKLADYPKAILNYERALRLDPSFSDARYNLEFAQGFTQDRIEAVPEFIIESVGRKMCYTLSSDTWTVLFLVLLALALGGGLVFLLSSTTGRRRAGFYCGLAFLFLSLLCLDFSTWQKRDYSKRDSAIVMMPVSSVKSSPSSGKDLFIIHEGTKVKILDNVGDWLNISLADGRQGWIESGAIEVI
ncbi:MAG: BatD family protein [Bacteroidales bacterium]|nr:BatD family protein [Bacteroidales bacterium]